MMYPWLDYKGLAYYSKKLRDKLKTAFNDVYEKITGTSDSIETLNSALDTTNKNVSQNASDISEINSALDTTNKNVSQNASDISEINSALTDFLVVESKTQSSVSVPANSNYTDITFDTTKSGYTFLGLVGWYFVNSSSGGQNSSWVILNRQQISGSNIILRLRNIYSDTAIIDCTVRLLYMKNI